MSGVTTDNVNRASGLVKAAGGGGKVLQAVTAINTETQSISGSVGSHVAIDDLSCAITPATANSKILIMISIGGFGSTGAQSGTFIVMRDDTEIGVADDAGSRVPGSFHAAATCSGGCHYVAHGFSVLDSPSSTSEITYTLTLNHQNGVTGYINRSGSDGDGTSGYQGRSASTMTAIEIGA